MKGGDKMNNTIWYDYPTFIREMYSYSIQQQNSYIKVYQALQDTIKFFDSMNKLNPQELNLYLQILSLSLSASAINK